MGDVNYLMLGTVDEYTSDDTTSGNSSGIYVPECFLIL